MRLPNIDELYVVAMEGTGNMGSVTDPATIARFGMRADRYALVYIRGDAIGGTSDADCVLRLDSHRLVRGALVLGGGSYMATPFDYRLFTFRNFGTDGNPINWRVTAEELAAGDWIFDGGDELVFEWTNPNTQRWALEVGLWDISHATP